jgi:RNA polymerase sigma factor (sigma-70 family)
MPAESHFNPVPQNARWSHRRPAKATSTTLLEMVGGLSDTDLMTRLQQSAGTNNRLLAELQSRHMDFVRRVARQANVRPDLVDDVAVDVWNRVWRNSTKPAGSKGAWNPQNSQSQQPFRSWLRTIAENTSRDFHRRLGGERRRRSRLQEFVDSYGENWQAARPERPDSCREAARSRPSASEPRAIRKLVVDRRTAAACRGLVLAAINELPERQRTALQRRAEGHGNGDIAATLGCGNAQACKIIIKARVAMIDHLLSASERSTADR